MEVPAFLGVGVLSDRGLPDQIRGLLGKNPLARSIHHGKETPVFTERTSVGLDVHARSIVAAAIDTKTGELTRAKLVPKAETVNDWLASLAGPVAVTYEAGPTGYWLCRALTAAGWRCEVAAPSRLPRAAGDRVKTDRRDALKLAEALRAEQIVSVCVPSTAREDARDLTRAHNDARIELMAARHRISKMLLRKGIVYYGGNTWTIKHDRWLRAQRPGGDHLGARAAFDDYYDNLIAITARRDRLSSAILEMAKEGPFTQVTRRLACLKGISTLTGFALSVEIGDWDRFTGSSIGAYLGLVPAEASSGEKTARGPITKAGNTHARRLLIEAAWHHTPGYRPSAAIRSRWDQVDDPAIRARADEGNRRLAQRRARLAARKKPASTINTAIARELAGWCWSLATMD